ncbi:hypothetical protein EYF80_063962 [Liparis tanakae]|uniref:Uncharacterized protein n=1 Tax=Liparis tanakae TaxID=230148 RepID=A0A4Z2EC72_9TELE|nr:hypothetical protein EYF80_063962 [Liparis tanakae]
MDDRPSDRRGRGGDRYDGMWSPWLPRSSRVRSPEIHRANELETKPERVPDGFLQVPAASKCF